MVTTIYSRCKAIVFPYGKMGVHFRCSRTAKIKGYCIQHAKIHAGEERREKEAT